MPLNRNSQQKRIIKQKLHKNQRGKCYYCDAQLSHDGATLDHILPSSIGGNHHISNLVLACRTCNEMKGDSKLWTRWDNPRREEQQIAL